MSDNQYFTPSIEDIRLGYECESLNAEEVRKWIPYTIKESTGTWPQFTAIREAIELGHIRVPYLTKEQIEAEGWKLLGYGGEGNIYEKEINGIKWEIWRDFGEHKLVVLRAQQFKYDGGCKDINTFRYICKLLKTN